MDLISDRPVLVYQNGVHCTHQHGLQSLVPFPDCTVNHSLIKTVPLLVDTLAQLFHVLDLVPVNTVLQSGNGARDCESAWQLTEDISNMHCEHDCFATHFNAKRLINY